MKKVGIATMTGSNNYGNSLQNYAVQEIINTLGYEAYTLRNTTKRGFLIPAKKPISKIKKLSPSYIMTYRRTKLNERYGCKNARSCRGKALAAAKKNVVEYREALKRRRDKFDRFNQTYVRFDDVEINTKRFPRKHLENFYAFVCGSDQVWNPYFHQNSMIDFLQFAPKHKRIAFVPSFGISKIPDTRIADFKLWLDGFEHLSVREDAGAQIIRELTGKEAQVLLDPTFGLTREQWLSFAKKPEVAPKGKYVFCYFLGNEIDAYCDYINDYAKQHDCEIVEMFDIHSMQYYDADPCEFVWLLAHAQAVFTDSFHGTAFSVNMQVPFVAFDRQEGGASMSSRITSLLKKTKLSERTFANKETIVVENVDFSAANGIVSSERKRIFDYLQSALACVSGKKGPLLATKYHCTGCGACANACNVKALKMVYDEEGFTYPRIEPNLCISCGACEKACPADIVQISDSAEPKAYFAYDKNDEHVKLSSSGGIFGVLAEHILEANGTVFGVGYDADFAPCHMAIRDKKDLYKLRTSKYVQSDTRTVYRDVKQSLKDAAPVLFVGTPCQVAALKQYLSKEYENLYTADIICHGVPSPVVWQEYLKQCHSDKQIRSISFRDKTKGWNQFSMRITEENGNSYCKLATKDPFVSGFLANVFLRPSCYQCQYKTLQRVSDLTMADYWGVELVHPELKEQQGVSLLLTHSDKGEKLFESIKQRMHWGETNRTEAIRFNHAALHSVPMHKKRSYFFENYRKQPFEKVVKYWLKKPLKKKIYRVIKVSGSKAKKLFRFIRGKR